MNVDIVVDIAVSGLIEYDNLPGPLGCLISSRLATLNELDTVYSVEDAYLLLDVIKVDAHNRERIRKAQERVRD